MRKEFLRMLFILALTGLFVLPSAYAKIKKDYKESTTSEAQAQEINDAAAIARGAQSWANTCARCHNSRNPKEFSNEQWQTIMMHMQNRAGISGQQTRDILKFIQGSR